MRPKGAQSLFKGNTAAMAIIFIILLGIVGYFVVVPAPYKEGYLDELPAVKYNNTVFDVSPGRIEETEEKTYMEKIQLPTATVDNSPQTESLLISNQLLIEKTLIEATYHDYDFMIDTNTYYASRLHFVVSDKIGDGTLTVKLNQHTIFSRRVGTGETLDISLPQMYLHEGVNTIRISVLGGDIWRTKSYLLTDVKLDLDSYINRVIEQHFSLTHNIAKDIEEARLTAYVKSLEDDVNLKVELNGEHIFEGLPASNFDLELPVNILHGGSNVLTWSTERGGKYNIRYGEVTAEETEIEEGGKRYYFSVSEKDMYFAVQDKYTCELHIVKSSGDNNILVTINSAAEEYTFKGGEITEDVCSMLKKGTNKIILSAEDEVVVSDLTLVVKNRVTTS